MSEGFERTVETAMQASSTAGMLLRLAEGGRPSAADLSRLRVMSAQYEAYAKALLESLPAAERGPDQVPLL